jgi:hypothetical protein
VIVLRTQPCVRIIEGSTFYPGMNGNIPTKLRENDSFKAELDLGYLKIIDGKPAEVPLGDLSIPSGPRPDRSDTIEKPDKDLVDAIVSSSPKKAIELIKDTLKVATLLEVQKVEKRGSVVAALSDQIEVLTKSDEAK